MITTGAITLQLAPGSDVIVRSLRGQDGPQILGPDGVRLVVADQHGKRRRVQITSLKALEEGPVRAQIAIEGVLGQGTGLRVTGTVSFFAGLNQLRIELTAQNPRRAKHPGGFWDLGDPGSVLLKEWSLEIDAAVGDGMQVEWLEQPGGTVQRTAGDTFTILQESSGGENWNSRNHVNRNGHIPLRFRGYRVRTDSGETTGDRASPVVSLNGKAGHVTCAVEEFWQKFPTSIKVQGNRVNVQFWPDDFGDLHELQAGEHATRTVWLDLGSNPTDACERLAWVHDPPIVSATPESIADSGCIPYFAGPTFAPREELETILSDAIEGKSSLIAKREAIDEYGWRNFGDIWADHEEAYCSDRPVISHYNNQYDLLHGLLIQFLQSGDSRWWQIADPLARHVMDIDIYHTTRDKPAYSGGMFWHTAHYLSAGRSSHRTMSTDMVGRGMSACGIGPGNEHNYSAGLLLYYQLTGNAKARKSVVGLADWVLSMDDGCSHLLGVASERPTGDASRTTEPNYHGPGRGAGNSINALLNGWLITDDKRYLQKLVELIQRTIHPEEDLALRNLGNAELRWSYTVYLQSLIRFLDLTSHVAELIDIRCYVRESILACTRWMLDNERFYLDSPESLEYPTETWAAQELRKGNVLLQAALLATPQEADRFRARGQELLERAWRSLLSFDTRTCTRPVALVLQQGYLETSLRAMNGCNNDDQSPANEWQSRTAPQTFISQKQWLKSALRSPVGWFHIVRNASRPGRWINAFQQTWLAERVRRVWD
ncbi:hypothetical protein NA78x_000243 [Anatilimnocola sp. NA78]|uniref:hypothetical protein n=1 Tax=Anatilimnocola sp. NA78 TaxID=3415683 RepID=UPI003CE4F112